MIEDSRQIRTLVVDDEKPARQRLLDLLENYAEITVVGECGSGSAAVRLIRDVRPELLFLDVQMPGLGGFEVVEQVGVDHLPVTIFVTAFDQYAVRAFEASALDYILKPYSDERFDVCLARALAHVRTHRREELSAQLLSLLSSANKMSVPPVAARQTAPARHLERLLVKSGGRVIFLLAVDVDWIEAAGVYVNLHTGGRKYMHRASLTELEAQLDPDRFIRIHRSSLVNIASVKELHPRSHGDYVAILKDGTCLNLSRSYRPKFETRLRQTL
jgi:two-component system LytT family response regulator